MTRYIALVAALFISAPAIAQDAAGDAMATVYDLATLDTDGSGSVSIEELLSVDDSVTPEAFAEADADASGALSEEELAAFSTSMEMSTE